MWVSIHMGGCRFGSRVAVSPPPGGLIALTGMARGVAAQHLIAPDAFDLAAAVQACQRFVERSLAAG
ncbi:hypothetical protein [Nocardia sp. NPDC004860]|uniref:hypothetical protein n=1 Tax=Nocardia sp. NPDC004860 TaxID=3154557 RepID=UPI0033A46544